MIGHRTGPALCGLVGAVLAVGTTAPAGSPQAPALRANTRFEPAPVPSGLNLANLHSPPPGHTPLLAFSAFVDGNWDIYTWDLDPAHQPMRRTHTAFDESGPSLSPDHSFCIYETVDGRLWRLSLEEGAPAGPEVLPAASDQTYDMHPAVSPGGRSVALATNLDRATDDSDLIVYDCETGRHGRRLELLAYQHYPAWAPDGRHVAFANLHGRMQTNGPLSEIWVMRTDAPWARQLTMLDSFSVAPSWSPRGDLVAFESNRGGDYNIWLVNPATRAYRRLTTHSAADTDPVFMPDGRSVVFESTRGGTLALWRIGLDGGRAVALHPFGADVDVPCRDPDCK